ncbi:MAG TPA: sulfatase-like hydrolase/transferase, partial [Armatimonadota bacterium]|nr:sulfatase-like hydrolase/transferase [Armatimonadota bacterium]
MPTHSRRDFLRVATAALVVRAAGPCLSAPGPRLPTNAIIILADDLGWADLNCYGNRVYETPNLDRLA